MGIYQVDDVINGILVCEKIEPFVNEQGRTQFDKLILKYEGDNWMVEFKKLNLTWQDLQETIIVDEDTINKYSIMVLYNTCTSYVPEQTHSFTQWWHLDNNDTKTKKILEL